MGIDKMSIAANYHNQAVQATQINKVNVQTSSDTAAKEMTADSKVSTASTVQITNTSKLSANLPLQKMPRWWSSVRKSSRKSLNWRTKKKLDIQKVINRNTIAEFGYNEPTNRITIKIKDKDTDEVIKEIPSEKALEMLAKAWELAGILVDEKR